MAVEIVYETTTRSTRQGADLRGGRQVRPERGGASWGFGRVRRVPQIFELSPTLRFPNPTVALSEVLGSLGSGGREHLKFGHRPHP